MTLTRRASSRPAADACPDPMAVPVDRRTAALLGLVAVLGLLTFCWPLLVAPESAIAGTQQAPYLFAALLPIALAVIAAEVSRGGLEVKALALLGVLSAIGAGLRVLGTGTAGIQPMFFLIVLAGRVFGPGFGFVLGLTAMGGSALITGGVGPWLPFQMIASGFVGLGAGLLPHRFGGRAVRGRLEIAVVAAYGAFTGFAYGTLMNLSFWPFTTGYGTGFSFEPGAGLGENLHTFVMFTLVTSVGYDAGRALTTMLLVIIAGPGLIAVLRRASRRARFGS